MAAAAGEKEKKDEKQVNTGDTKHKNSAGVGPQIKRINWNAKKAS